MITLAAAWLARCRILVVEDEYMIADEIVSLLDGAGVTVVGPVSNVEDALNLIISEHELDAAILDVNLLGKMVWPVMEELLEQGVPVVFLTGYDSNAIPAKYATVLRCEKPAAGRDILKALESVISTAS